ncbi:MAG: hypothetical protein GXP19_00070 [Gammaproteobacteria bacterium]|nr:hypothetical protein [Gammaproteobacteria bacterium]
MPTLISNSGMAHRLIIPKRIFGITIAKVNEDLKLTFVEHIFDTGQFLTDLAAGSKCPIQGHS